MIELFDYIFDVFYHTYKQPDTMGGHGMQEWIHREIS